jgi:hypothetical protein
MSSHAVVRIGAFLIALGLLLGSAPTWAAAEPQEESSEETVDEKTQQPSEEPTETTETAKVAAAEKTSTKQATAILVDNSNTGYIDNAIVRTRVQVRADAATLSNEPDRAEFFYAKCGCFANPALAGVLGPAFDPTAPGPGDLPEADVNYQDLETTFEYAFLKNRVSFLAEVPLRRVELGDNNATFSGIADIRLGAKVALLASEGRHLTFQLKSYIPTGDARKGLSINHTSWEPGLLYYQRFASRFAFESELRYFIPTSGSSAVGLSDDTSDEFSGNIVRLGVAIGYVFTLRSGLTITPVGEVVGWRVFGGFKTPTQGEVDADGDNIVNLKLGARIGFDRKNSVYAGFGTALTDNVWYEEIIRLEYRYGPF